LPNTHSLCFSLNIRDYISHPYKTPGRIMAVRNCLFNLFAATLRILRTRHAVVIQKFH
jgi:hypothetical protein